MRQEGGRGVGKKERSEPGEQPSLLPSVGEKEQELRRLLLEARAESERAIEEARRRAAERVEAAKKETPLKMERKRAEGVVRIQAEIEGRKEGIDGTERAVELRAAKNLHIAVDLIVSAILPKGER
jgi:F0F1-type ATP synthase membrane subunit b/b'